MSKATSINEIHLWGRRLRLFTILLVWLGLAAYVLLLYMGKIDDILHLPENVHIDPVSLSASGWLVVALLGAIRPLAFAPVLWSLYRLFSAYEKGIVFSLQNIRWIRLCGLSLIAIDVIFVLHSMLVGPVLSEAAITGRFFVIQFGISYSIIGLFVFLTSKIMQLAQSSMSEKQTNR